MSEQNELTSYLHRIHFRCFHSTILICINLPKGLLNSLVNLLLLKALIPASCDQIKWNNKTDFNFINWNVKTSSLKIVIAEQLLSVANFTSSNFSYFILWLSMIKCSNLPKSYITLQNLYFEVCTPLIFWLLILYLALVKCNHVEC